MGAAACFAAKGDSGSGSTAFSAVALVWTNFSSPSYYMLLALVGDSLHVTTIAQKSVFTRGISSVLSL